MNQPPILGNGWVEAYLFGILDPQEMKVMEQLIFNQKEWNEEWLQALESLETMIRKWEQTPEPALRKKIFELTGIPSDTTSIISIPTPELLKEDTSSIERQNEEIPLPEPQDRVMEETVESDLNEELVPAASHEPKENSSPIISSDSADQKTEDIPLEIVIPSTDIEPVAEKETQKDPILPNAAQKEVDTPAAHKAEHPSPIIPPPTVIPAAPMEKKTEPEKIKDPEPEKKTEPEKQKTYSAPTVTPSPAEKKQKIQVELKESRKAKGGIRPIAAILYIMVFSSLTAAGYFMYQSLEQSSSVKFLDEEVARLKKDKEKMVSEAKTAEDRYKQLESSLSILQEPGLHLFELKGKPISPDASALIGWNFRTGELFITRSGLPAPPEGKQYQIWGIKDSIVVDAGLIPLDYNGKGVHMLKEVEDADAFAITLEEKGGAKSPTTQQMYVLGKAQ